MRILTTVVLLGFLATVMSCGEAGVGFNIGKEIAVDLPEFVLPQFTPAGTSVSEEGTYDLSEVTGDVVNDVEIVEVTYEISGVDANEQVNLTGSQLEIRTKDDSVIGTVPLAGSGSTLQNTSSPQPTNFNYDILADALVNGSSVITKVTFEVGENLTNEVSFDFTLNFDVVAKIRE